MGSALVTGASSGIGLATAVALARAGHTVAAAMRPSSDASEIERIAAAEKLPLRVFRIDVDDDSSVTRGFAEVVAAQGPIDVLVNNAGVGGGAAIEETSLDMFRGVMETNFFGALRCVKAVAPSMRERRKGLIVNVTSVAGRLALPPQGAYASSKWALEALSEILAQEMRAFGVRVAIVEPGVIATPIFSKAAPPIENSPYPQARRLRAVFAAALTRPNPPESVAQCILGIVADPRAPLRHLVGADAKMLLEWRKSQSDEAVIEGAAVDDATYAARMKAMFGVDLNL